MPGSPRLRESLRAYGITVAALLVIVAVGFVGYIAFSDSTNQVADLSRAVIPPPEPSTTTAATTTTTLPPRFRVRAADVRPGATVALPRAPILSRRENVEVWTGHLLVEWGGVYLEQSRAGETGTTLDDGAAFDPVSGLWHVIRGAPINGRADANAVWTGKEIVIWGGNGPAGTVADGAAYDPVADSWRRIAAAPRPFAAFDVATLWDGSEVLAAGGGFTLGYDPVTDRWRSVAPAPIDPFTALAGPVWTGTLAVFHETYGRESRSPPRAPNALVLYNATTETWSTVTYPGPLVAVAPFAWTGQEVLVGVQTAQNVYSLTAFDPATGAFRALPLPPGELRGTPFWTGRSLLYPATGSFSNGTVVAYSTDDGVWHEAAGATLVGQADFWADGVLIGWSGGSRSFTAGAMYRPPRRIPT